MAGLGFLMLIWIYLRLPETLKPENRRAFTLASVIQGFAIVFSDRQSLSYILATAVIFGALMGFLNSSQQIYVSLYDMGAWFPLFFALGGIASAASGFANSQLVTRFGMEKLSHHALVLFVANSLLVFVLSTMGIMNVWLFLGLSIVWFMCFNFIMSNFGALAMVPLGEVAGTAASTQGFLQMIIGASLGALIGQFYNGTTVPLAFGFLVLSSIAMLIVRFGAKPN
jgi:MFS transporter, DHA1 family, multidrug resistance protein